jgi:hypothetical protein
MSDPHDHDGHHDTSALGRGQLVAWGLGVVMLAAAAWWLGATMIRVDGRA